MDWGTLLAVLLGGLLAFASQWIIELRLAVQRDRSLLVEACANFIASCEDQRNQIWEFRQGIAVEQSVRTTDVHAHRTAYAQVFLLSNERPLLDALARLRQAGLDLDRAWRQSVGEAPDFDGPWLDYKVALDQFSNAARVAVAARHSLGRPST